jgi:hypothetical protein
MTYTAQSERFRKDMFRREMNGPPVSGWVTHECRLFGAKQRSATAWFGGYWPFFSTSVAVGSTKWKERSIGASFLHRPGDHRVRE